MKIPDNHKFAMVVLQDCDSAILTNRSLPNGTLVSTDVSDLLTPDWCRWLGDARTERLERANLVIIRHAISATPDVVDRELDILSAEVNVAFNMLMIGGVPKYREAFSIRGAALNGELRPYQLGQMHTFYQSPSPPVSTITVDRLVAADAALRAFLDVEDGRQFQRFKTGIGRLIDGLRQKLAEERMHQYVRSLEALILPDPGSTCRQFVHRCLTFVGASDVHRNVLTESFGMRSDAEHLHDWRRTFAHYPESEQESVALRRLRQIEHLASTAYLRILCNGTLRRWFASDVEIAALWAKPDDERMKIWGSPIGLNKVK